MQEVITTSTYDTPFGQLIIGAFNKELVLCDWAKRTARTSIDKRIQVHFNATFRPGDNELIVDTKQQLEQYFIKKREQFDLPIHFAGTNFQKQVWSALSAIPYGTTMSYKDLAIELGNLEAIRAVAGANGANALSIVIPCHRVIGTDGSLTGYAGGNSTKQGLLELEGALNTSQLPLF